MYQVLVTNYATKYKRKEKEMGGVKLTKNDLGVTGNNIWLLTYYMLTNSDDIVQVETF